MTQKVNYIAARDRYMLGEIVRELGRARAKFPGVEHMTCAAMEEMGEVARALLQLEHEPAKGKRSVDVAGECIQLAAMAIRIATEGDTTYTRYDPAEAFADLEAEAVPEGELDAGP